MRYYLLLNGIEVEDLGIEEKEFTMEKKLKFIQNCSKQFADGKELVNQIFFTLSVDHNCSLFLLCRITRLILRLIHILN